jgi:hypothetical protein
MEEIFHSSVDAVVLPTTKDIVTRETKDNRLEQRGGAGDYSTS